MAEYFKELKSNGASMTIEMTEDHTDELMQKLAASYYRGLRKIGMRAVYYAKQELQKKVYSQPEKGYVRTGRLLNSITYKVSGQDVYIGSNVKYAPYVECGTGRNSSVGGNPLFQGMRPRPYLKPAATEHGKEYGEILKSEVNK